MVDTGCSSLRLFLLLTCWWWFDDDYRAPAPSVADWCWDDKVGSWIESCCSFLLLFRSDFSDFGLIGFRNNTLVIFLISQKRFDLLVFQSKYKFQVAVEKSSWRRKQEVSQIDTDLFWFKQWKINDLQYYIQYLKWIKINIKCIVTMAQRCIWRSIKLR